MPPKRTRGAKAKRVLRAVKRAVAPNLTTRKAINAALAMAGATSLARPVSSGVVNAMKGFGLFGVKNQARASKRPVPVAMNTTTKNQTWNELVGKATSRYAGSDAIGIKIRGSQPLAYVTKPNSGGLTGQVFASDTATISLDATGDIYIIYLCPHSLGGPLLVQAASYEMYAFRKARLRYTTTVGADTEGQFALCYLRDPNGVNQGSTNVPISFQDCREVNPSMSFMARGWDEAMSWSYNGEQLWYCDPGASPDLRLCHQGQLRCFIDGIGSTGSILNMGYLTLDYEVDLFNPVPSSDLTFAARSLKVHRDDRKALAEYADQLRKSRTDMKSLMRGFETLSIDQPDEDMPDARKKRKIGEVEPPGATERVGNQNKQNETPPELARESSLKPKRGYFG